MPGGWTCSPRRTPVAVDAFGDAVARWDDCDASHRRPVLMDAFP